MIVDLNLSDYTQAEKKKIQDERYYEQLDRARKERQKNHSTVTPDKTDSSSSSSNYYEYYPVVSSSEVDILGTTYIDWA